METGSVFPLDNYDPTSRSGVWECLHDLLLEHTSCQEELAAVKQKLDETTQALADAAKEIQRLKEQNQLARHHRFGSSSEKWLSDGRLTLFDLIEGGRELLEAMERAPKESVPEAPEEEATEVKAHKRRKRKARRDEQIPDDAELRIIEHHLSEDERRCPECGELRPIIGTSSVDRLGWEPARPIRERHVQDFCCCPHCKAKHDEPHVEAAPIPKAPIPGSFATSDLLAWIIDQKYVLGLPLYRIEQALGVQKVMLPRQTLSGWMIRCADIFEPLYHTLRRLLLQGDIIMSDDTSLQVLREPGRKAQSKSYLWTYRTGMDAKIPIILYDYQQSHSADCPKAFLDGFKGWLQADGYQVYDDLSDDIRLVRCLAHIRRKFHEAWLLLPEERRPGSLAEEGLRWCKALYNIESAASGFTPEERKQYRLIHAKPIVEDFEKWLNKQVRFVGKSKVGDAVRYGVNHFEDFKRYLEDGRLAIDNNLTEREAIKPVVMGRKAWLFANTPRGAEASAILYSLVMTAKANGLVPLKYLKWLLDELPNAPKNDPDWALPYLPHNAKERMQAESASGTPAASEKNIQSAPLAASAG